LTTAVDVRGVPQTAMTKPTPLLTPILPPTSALMPSLFNEGPDVSLRDNFRIKYVCRYASEYYDGLMRLFSLETKGYIARPHFLVALGFQ